MKIKSTFKDYYDRCQGYGVDDVVYMRYPKTQVINTKGLIYSIYIEGSIICDVIYIGFCGKIYPALNFRTYYNYSDAKTFYNIDSLDKYIKTLHPSIQEDYFNNKYIYRKGNRSSIKNLFDTNIQNVFSESVIFTISKNPDTIINPEILLKTDCNLSKYDFGKVFPPNLAYQEIHSYLNNKAIPMKPIPTLDDKTMAEIKGFDKWSFRKEPKKKTKS